MRALRKHVSTASRPARTRSTPRPSLSHSRNAGSSCSGKQPRARQPSATCVRPRAPRPRPTPRASVRVLASPCRRVSQGGAAHVDAILLGVEPPPASSPAARCGGFAARFAAFSRVDGAAAASEHVEASQQGAWRTAPRDDPLPLHAAPAHLEKRKPA